MIIRHAAAPYANGVWPETGGGSGAATPPPWVSAPWPNRFPAKSGNRMQGRYDDSHARDPLLSRWVFRDTYASVDSCRSDCANNCGNNVRNNSAMRGGVFGSVGSLGNGNCMNIQGNTVWLTCRTKCMDTFQT